MTHELVDVCLGIAMDGQQHARLREGGHLDAHTDLAVWAGHGDPVAVFETETPGILVVHLHGRIRLQRTQPGHFVRAGVECVRTPCAGAEVERVFCFRFGVVLVGERIGIARQRVEPRNDLGDGV